MVNQLMKFCPYITEMTQPLHYPLKKGTAWHWGDNQQQAFEKSKSKLASDTVLALYDPEKETVVSADANNNGLGGVLLQRQHSVEMQAVANRM